VADSSIQARLKGWLTAAWRFVSSAPLTYVWLIVLLITTIIQHSLSRRELHTLLIHQSTNIHELATDPLQVLFTSLFWFSSTSRGISKKHAATIQMPSRMIWTDRLPTKNLPGSNC